MNDWLELFLGLAPWVHYLMFFGVLLACGLGLPLPEDLVIVAGGISAYYGVTNLWATIAVCYLGVMLGDLAIFALGRVYGSRLTRRWIFHKLLPDDRLALVRAKLHQRGNRLVFAARFMPGLRAPIYFTAGSLHLPFRIFLFYYGVAALLSVPAIVGAVYLFGHELDLVIRTLRRIEHGAFVVALIVIGLMVLQWRISHRKLKASKLAAAREAAGRPDA